MFKSSFSSEISMIVRPVIFIVPYLFFLKNLSSEPLSYLSFGFITGYIQADLIIGINYRYYILESNYKLFDIELSKTNPHVMIFFNYGLQIIILTIFQMLAVAIFLNNNLYIYLLITCTSVLSIVLGIYLTSLTRAKKTFMTVAKLSSIIFLTGSSVIPLYLLPKLLQYIFLLNPYTALFEMIRGIYQNSLMEYEFSFLVVVFAFDILLAFLLRHKIYKLLNQFF